MPDAKRDKGYSQLRGDNAAAKVNAKPGLPTSINTGCGNVAPRRLGYAYSTHGIGGNLGKVRDHENLRGPGQAELEHHLRGPGKRQAGPDLRPASSRAPTTKVMFLPLMSDAINAVASSDPH